MDIQLPLATREYRHRLAEIEKGKVEGLRALHVGVAPENLGRLPFLDAEVNRMAVAVDGDGWNAWGEAPGTDSNDATTLHVVYLSRDERSLRDWLVLTAGDVLVPMNDGNDAQIGAAIVSTHPADWAEESDVLLRLDLP